MKELMKWQWEAVQKGTGKDSFALFCEPGTGKTLAALRLWRESGPSTAVIIAPLVTVFNWSREIIDDCPRTRWAVPLGNLKKRQESCSFFLQRDEVVRFNVVVVSYSLIGATDMLKFFAILNTLGDFTLIVDEAHYIKSASTKRHKIISQLAAWAKKRIFLTGTPLMTGLENLFYIYRAMDGGKTFGSNVYGFRGRYMFDANAALRLTFPGRYYPNYLPKATAYGEIQEAIEPSCYQVTLPEVVDLPPLQEILIYTEMLPAQQKIYRQMERRFLTEFKGNTASAVIALTKMVKLMQIVSGFFFSDEGTEVDIMGCANPRMKALGHLVDKINRVRASCVIWYQFDWERKTIRNLFNALGIDTGFIHGNQGKRERFRVIDDFAARKLRFVICQRTAGGIGINLTAASYSIVFSRGFGMGADLQGKARNYRKGSEVHKQIIRYILFTKGTIDELVDYTIKKQITDNKTILTRFINLKEKEHGSETGI